MTRRIAAAAAAVLSLTVISAAGVCHATSSSPRASQVSSAPATTSPYAAAETVAVVTHRR